MGIAWFFPFGNPRIISYFLVFFYMDFICKPVNMFYNLRGEDEIVLLCACSRVQKRMIFLRIDETKKYGENKWYLAYLKKTLN